VTDDSGHGRKSVTFTRNEWSHSTGIVGHVRPESVVTRARNTQLVRAVYFSLVTFTTLGYGDILPRGDLMRLACGSEALIGAFTMGFVVAGFANRSRY